MKKKCREKYEFVKGNEYFRSEVVGVCHERIREGCIKREETKTALVRAMEKHAPAKMVWQPAERSGLRPSPFNPNCWRTTEGSSILSQKDWRTVSKDLKVMRAEIYKK